MTGGSDYKDAILLAQIISADREHLRSLREGLLNAQDVMDRAKCAYGESLELLRRLEDRPRGG